jgi:hypothetical protein
VNTAEPETATAQYLELEPEFLTADWIASDMASTSCTDFSTITPEGKGSIAK